MDSPRVFSMSPQKGNLRWLYLTVFASLLLIQRSTAYSVKKSCTTPDGTKSEGEVWYDDARCIKMTCMQGFPVTSSCGKPQPRGKNCRPIPGKGRFPECCTKLLCQTGFSPSNMGLLTQQARRLPETDGVPAMRRSALEPVKQLARSAPRSAPSNARSSGPRLASEVLRGNAVPRGRSGGSESAGPRLTNEILGRNVASRGRSGGLESRASEDMMESVRTVGLEPSDAEERLTATEYTEEK
uniref:Single domain-containing protein n=1 Tax=Rhipicephalus appendiculatus TaxID=34631 RepID=A0A131YHK0_RHIAP